MADQFAHSPTIQTEGITIEEWINKFYDTNSFEGEDEISVLQHDGSFKKDKIKNACIVIYNSKWLRNKDNKNTNYGCFTGDIENCYFNTRQVYCSLLRHSTEPKHSHILRMSNVIIIPLALITKNINDNIVFMNIARYTMSLGMNNINLSEEHVATMFMSALQNIAYKIFSEEHKESREWYINIFNHIFNSTKRYIETYKEAYNIIKPISYANEAHDVLERSISFLFIREKTEEDKIRLIEIALKRMKKRNNLNLLNNCFGLLACLFISNQLTNNEVENIVTKVRKTISDKAAENTSLYDKNIKILYNIFELAFERKFTIDHIKTFYDYISNETNHKSLINLNLIGITENKETNIKYLAGQFNINKHTNNNYVYTMKADENSISIIGGSPANWCAITLGNGKYKINCENVGNSIQAIGNSLGEEQKAIIRFTSGYDIMSNDTESISSSGVKGKLINRRINFISTGNILELDKEFDLTIKNNKITVEQNNKIFCNYTISKSFLLAFKYLILNITKQEEIEEENIDTNNKYSLLQN